MMKTFNLHVDKTKDSVLKEKKSSFIVVFNKSKQKDNENI